jgi:hypothetical protein
MFQEMSGMGMFYKEPMKRPPTLGGYGFSSSNPKVFTFNGSAMSFQARVDALTEQEINRIVDVNIMVTGIEVRHGNSCL